ncbi:hypothetical protein F3Y22_tig00110733pilonHSYRG00142 [Hibiscus syriacus]|uniref:RNase H type-1 domain-containing protein n=1 Tax=Hibiscus syriacus TaxID=106335 RepID=A0A6A2ZV42_HIBSY|nr:hypothetical protein F3Y22_tig00110733pilonHSYRG00142 [Hibiscus syriacus]
MGYHQIFLETDSKELFNLLRNISTSQGVSSLIPYVKALLNQDWSVSVRHIPREYNKVADILAHLAWSLAPGLVTFQDPPVECISALLADGVLQQRNMASV